MLYHYNDADTIKGVQLNLWHFFLGLSGIFFGNISQVFWDLALTFWTFKPSLSKKKHFGAKQKVSLYFTHKITAFKFGLLIRCTIPLMQLDIR